ncbi:DUF6440 family protein [Agrilactobacillus yilanensis]|uniref:DUF6440 family protein n=1 Tax=Agrilactobacillus yilanensis TaxID=2485997 RepID=A0ABW4J5Y2_9LACO|nr:DUF6440 family protein [Agrilactobacillus yilanensis]
MRDKKEKRFTSNKAEVTGLGTIVNIVTDTTTGVQYLVATSTGGVGLTVLVDQNGKPLLADQSEN